MSEYTRTNWVNGSTATPINANNLNNIEEGISSNKNDIQTLIGSMKFIRVTSTLPQDAEIGYVYQASEPIIIEGVSCKVGDLLVYTSQGWHIIPSGDETNGTVTQVIPGTGLVGNTITTVGTISIDPLYIDNKISSEIDNLANVAKTGEWADIRNVPTTVNRTLYQATGSDAAGIMSQNAITNALLLKADSIHEHEISDIQNLSSLLASDGSTFVQAAKIDHDHGLISSDGRLYEDANGGYVTTTKYLCTDGGNGTITSTSRIPSTSIEGFSFTQNSPQEYTVNIRDIKEYIEDLDDHLPHEGTEEEPGPIKDIAEKDHTHNRFFDNVGSDENKEYIPGFVQPCAEIDKGDYVLCGNGQWVQQTEVVTSSEKNEFVMRYKLDEQQHAVEDQDNPILKVVVLDQDPEELGDEFNYQSDCLYLVKG